MISNFMAYCSILAHRRKYGPSSNQATLSEAGYQQWRQSELERQFTENFRVSDLTGKRVLDFGCGTGELSIYAANAGAKEVIGTELGDKAYNSCLTKIVPSNVRFMKAEASDKIDLPDASADVVLCFDVMEHVLDYKQVIPEWYRILSPNGKVLIWWTVWMHPYGHHEVHILPMPWVHLFMPMSTIYRACAKVYESPDFVPRKWHFDENGQRKPNPYLTLTEATNLNKLTTGRAEREFRKAGFDIVKRDIQPFTGKSLTWLKKALVKLPVPDAFCSGAVYELKKKVD